MRAAALSPSGRLSAPRAYPPGSPCVGASSEASVIASVLPTCGWRGRSEEHTSELQSRLHLVCRLLLEKKKHSNYYTIVAKSHQRHDLPHAFAKHSEPEATAPAPVLLNISYRDCSLCIQQL